MRVTRTAFPLVLCALLLLTACDEETRTAFNQLTEAIQSSEQISEGLQEMTRAIEEMEENGEMAEPVDFRELRDLLPQSVGNLELDDVEGARQTMGGISVAHAKATFRGENRGRLNVEITDMGGIGGLAALGLGMMMVEVDRESTHGFERTGDYNGHRMHEKWDGQRERGEITVLVANRFAVKAEGRNVSMDDVKSAVDQINLGTLEGLK